MKILFIIDDLTSGGAQRQLIYLAKKFRKDYNFIVEVGIYHSNLFYKKYLLDNDILIHEIYSKGKISRIFKFRKLIRKNKYDIVISYLMTPNILNIISSLPIKKWKVIVNERSANREFSFRNFIYRLFYLFSDGIVTNSYENLEIIKKSNFLLGKKRSIVIYNSIDFDYFRPLEDFKYKKDGKVRIVVLSSHQYLKNLKGLVLALNMLTELEKKMIEVSWYGAVKDNSLKQAKQLIEEFSLENFFYFHSETNDVAPIIQKADIIGLFSFYEGFPNAICEGMACAKPVISPKISDIPKILSNHKQFLFNPSQPDDILRVIRNMINLNSTELLNFGKNNFTIAKKTFDLNINTDLLIKFIR